MNIDSPDGDTSIRIILHLTAGNWQPCLKKGFCVLNFVPLNKLRTLTKTQPESSSRNITYQS